MRNNNILMFDIGTAGSSSSKDYIENHIHAKEMANRIEEFYHKRGFNKVRVWLEPELQASGRRFWYIRSSIVFRVP